MVTAGRRRAVRPRVDRPFVQPRRIGNRETCEFGAAVTRLDEADDAAAGCAGRPRPPRPAPPNPEEALRARHRHRRPHPRVRARRLDRPGPARGRHRPGARRRRRAEGRQRPPRHRDEPGPAGLHAVPARHAARPERRRLDRPRPLRALGRPLQPDPLHPAVPLRLRPGAGRPRGAAHVGQQDPRPPRAPPHPRRRDHHRPAGPGPGLRRRHGDGRPPRARPVRPGRPRWARARSTTTSSSSPPTATSRRASPPRPRRSPAPSSWATSPWSTTTTRSPSRTTPRSRCSEDTAKRYEAYGWHVQVVEGGENVTGHPRGARDRARPRPTGRRSSCCARSSASRRRRR